ncbi:Uncharacterised protein [Levilactobacillus brevis]|nr:Uncharacterised protein [Levilactobacillus brevis]
MILWHKKRVLTWPSELKGKLLVSNIYNANSTSDGRWLQWH